MPQYKYTARTAQGKIITGALEVSDKETLIKILRAQGLLVTSISEELPKSARYKFSFRRKKITLDDLALFSRQMATMIGAGLRITECLDVLIEQMEKPVFKRILSQVKDDITAGSTLSAALSKHPQVFSELMVSMIRAGEESGNLPEILNRLATYMEKSGSLFRKVKSALAYPTVIVCVAIGVTAFVLIKVIPVFIPVYASFQTTLPLPTLILIGVSKVLSRYFFIFLPALIGLFFLFRYYISTEKGRYKFDSFKLKLPLLGELFQKVSIAKFARTLSTLYRSGVPIIKALDIVTKTAGNAVIEKGLIITRLGVAEGKRIADHLRQTGVFPPMVTRMVDVGERTGQLDEMLSKIADFYEDQVDATVSSLTSVIEPILIVFIGIIIGGIVIAMYLPIFRMVGLVTK